MDERARTRQPVRLRRPAERAHRPLRRDRLPERGAKHDWELELAAVIGRPARNLTRENALDHVAGYTICNDLTTRDAGVPGRPEGDRHRLVRRRRTPPRSCRPAPTWSPRSSSRDPADLRITLRHNGDRPAGREHRRHALRPARDPRLHHRGHRAAPRRPGAHRLPGRERHALGGVPRRRATCSRARSPASAPSATAVSASTVSANRVSASTVPASTGPASTVPASTPSSRKPPDDRRAGAAPEGARPAW